MARELSGPTIGGDFVVVSVEVGSDSEGHLHVVLEHGDAHGESATMALQILPDRFKRFPREGDKHRVALELTRVRDDDDPYDTPREPRVKVDLPLLEEVEHLLTKGDFEEGSNLDARRSSLVGAIAAMRTQLSKRLDEAESG